MHLQFAFSFQQAQVARLARKVMSSPEIGARLFISARTVRYHLGKAFAMLDISSRNQLHRTLPADLDSARPHQARRPACAPGPPADGRPAGP